jgi:Calcineurin-like phosphoesterase
MATSSRIVELPASGTIFVATDLQGNVRDFDRIAAIFEAREAEYGDAHLLITGDLVHGPEYSREQWPPHLGSYYVGDSGSLLERAEALQARHAGRVHYLLGNHEHAHVGGPVVGKFFPDEAARLEQLLGAERTERVRTWLRDWPLVAVAPRAGLCFLHAAPGAPLAHRDELDTLPVDGGPGADPTLAHLLVALLWSRGATLERARSFLRAVGPDLTAAVHGHDVVREGYAVEHEACLCMSSSFGCYDGDKVYLRWDLSERAPSAEALVRQGLCRLWPEEPPVYLEAGGTEP